MKIKDTVTYKLES